MGFAGLERSPQTMGRFCPPTMPVDTRSVNFEVFDTSDFLTEHYGLGQPRRRGVPGGLGAGRQLDAIEHARHLHCRPSTAAARRWNAALVQRRSNGP